MILRDITSVNNPHLKEIAKIRKAPTADLFFIEGTRFTEELPAECLEEVFTTDPGKHEAFLSALPETVPVYRLSQSAMDKICAAVSEQTLACTVHRPRIEQPDKLVLLDTVQDPGNVGTVIRTAYAFGFGVILSPGCANPWSAKALMATAGAFRTCYIEQCEHLESRIRELRANGFSVFATALDPTAVSPESLSLSEKRAVVIGSEGQGISDSARHASDQTVFIPMQNPINSLNAAVAAALMIYTLR